MSKGGRRAADTAIISYNNRLQTRRSCERSLWHLYPVDDEQEHDLDMAATS